MNTRDRSFSTQFARIGLVFALAFTSGACVQTLDETQAVADADDAACAEDGTARTRPTRRTS